MTLEEKAVSSDLDRQGLSTSPISQGRSVGLSHTGLSQRWHSVYMYKRSKEPR